MISPVLAVLILATMPSVIAQCTTKHCNGADDEASRWENGGVVYLESLLADTTEKILKAVERRLAEQTEALENRLNAVEASLTARFSSPERVFLRRVDGSVNFTRNWADYKSGFGDVNGEFWLGLETLHQLTTRHQYGLRVDIEDFSGERKWASYQFFRVWGESGNYSLTISGYRPDSTAGDGLTYNNGMEFSTYDRDNDQWVNNCAATNSKGGWWYNKCAYANPTGVYKPAGYRGGFGINWNPAYHDERSFKSMSLKLVEN